MLRHERVVVEWAFGRLKMWFGIFRDRTWRLSIHRLPLIFRAACLLSNYLFRIRDCYPAVDPEVNILPPEDDPEYEVEEV